MLTGRASFFKEHGWLKVDNLFTREEVDEVRSELLKLQGIAIRNGERAMGQPADYYKRSYVGEICEPARISPFFKRFATSEKMGAIMREVMGVPGIRLFRDLGLIKAPATENGIGTNLHQDLVYLPLERCEVASIWIALTDLPANSGTMRFVDGSHKWGPVIKKSIPVQEWMAEHPEQGVLVTQPPALSAGSATIHDGYTLHGSDANTWGQRRIGFTLAYFRADAPFNGMPSLWTDGLGLKVHEPLDHEFFPLVA